MSVWEPYIHQNQLFLLSILHATNMKLVLNTEIFLKRKPFYIQNWLAAIWRKWSFPTCKFICTIIWLKDVRFKGNRRMHRWEELTVNSLVWASFQQIRKMRPEANYAGFLLSWFAFQAPILESFQTHQRYHNINRKKNNLDSHICKYITVLVTVPWWDKAYDKNNLDKEKEYFWLQVLEALGQVVPSLWAWGKVEDPGCESTEEAAQFIAAQ